MGDSEFAQRSRRGGLVRLNPLLYNQLVASHQATGYNLAYRLLGDGQSAETAVGRSVLLLFQQMEAVAERDFPCLFLRAIVRICAEMEPAVAERGKPLSDEVQNGFNHLSYEQRTVLLLADLCGLTHGEIGAVADMSEEAVRQMLSQARTALRNFWFGSKRITGQNGTVNANSGRRKLESVLSLVAN
jgi:DNA-directed RNA polymerase specialized sigma24 family protein